MTARSIEAKGGQHPTIAHIPMEIVQRISGEKEVVEKFPLGDYLTAHHS
jgi:hypothetical protein